MSVTMQVKLLRVLQERRCAPVGGTQEIAIDVRVIAATNRDLDATGRLRRRFAKIFITASASSRSPCLLCAIAREDIAALAHHFLKKYSPGAGKSIVRISAGRDGDAARL